MSPNLAPLRPWRQSRSGNVEVKLACSVASKCAGTGTLSTLDKGSSHALVLAKGTFALGAGQTMTVSFAATPGGRQFLAASRGRPFTGSLAVALTGGKSEIVPRDRSLRAEMTMPHLVPSFSAVVQAGAGPM